MTLPPGCRQIGDECLELALPGRGELATQIARLEGAAAIAIDQRRHLLLDLQGRHYVDSVLVETISAERLRLSEAHLDLIEFGATGVARQILKNARRHHEDRPRSPSHRSLAGPAALAGERPG